MSISRSTKDVMKASNVECSVYFSLRQIRFFQVRICPKDPLQRCLRIVEVCLGFKAVFKDGSFVVNPGGDAFLINLANEYFLTVRQDLHLNEIKA